MIFFWGGADHTVILVDTEETFDKIQYPSFVKTLKRLQIEGNLFNTIKGIYEKPKANIILNGETLKAFPLRSGKRKGCLILAFPFYILLDVLATAFR